MFALLPSLEHLAGPGDIFSITAWGREEGGRCCWRPAGEAREPCPLHSDPAPHLSSAEAEHPGSERALSQSWGTLP